MKTDNKFLFTCFYSFFVNGTFILLFGAILSYMIHDYHLTYAQGGFLVSICSIGNLVANFFGGVILNAIGRRKTLISIGVNFLICLLGMIFCSNYILLCMAMFIGGLGWGTNNNAVNVLVSKHIQGKSHYMIVMHSVFAVGAFMTPLVVGFLMSMGFNFRVPIMIVAVLSFLLILLCIKIPLDHVESAVDENKIVGFGFLKNIRYYVFMFILFFYVGAETGINNWVITYLDKMGIVSGAISQNFLSIFWVLMIVGRLGSAHLSRFIKKETLLLVICFSCFITSILFVAFKSPIFVIIFIALLGLSMAGVYPVAVSNANTFLVGGGMASGIMFSAGGLGATAIPVIMGKVADDHGIWAGMTVVVVSAFLCFIFAFANKILGEKSCLSTENNI